MGMKPWIVLPALLVLATAPLSAAEYRYDEKNSKLTFTVRHFNMVTVLGYFFRFSGSFVFDPEKVEQSRVRLKIVSASLDSKNSMRDKDFRSENFFWVEKFPEITFESREFREIQGLSFNIYGDLTIRGISKPVVFRTTLLTPLKEVDPRKPVRFHTETFIRRKDFKLGTSGFNPVMLVTNESLKISLDVEGTPAPELDMPPA